VHRASFEAYTTADEVKIVVDQEFKIVGADHANWYSYPKVRHQICNVTGQIAANWNVDKNRDSTRTESILKYDEVSKEVTWTGWISKEETAPQQVQINWN
jgi:hypothetical protein